MVTGSVLDLAVRDAFLSLTDPPHCLIPLLRFNLDSLDGGMHAQTENLEPDTRAGASAF